MFDITSVAVSETSTFQLRDASDNLLFAKAGDGEAAKPVNVTVYGPGSKEHARAVAKRSSRHLARLRKKGGGDLSADDIASEGAEFLASITVGFDNLTYKGLTGHEMHKALYTDRSLGFIADQVNEHVGAWENFSKGSETSSI